jgi:membrane protein
MQNRIQQTINFIRLVARRFSADNVPQTSASLTYTTLLAIVPLITIGLTIFSAFPAFETISTNLKIFILENMLPEAAGKVISVYMFQFSQNAGKLTAIGTVVLAITAFMLMHTIEGALNGIWHVRRARPLTQRLLIFWAVLSLGPVLIGGSLYVTSYFASLALGLGHEVHGATLYVLKFVPITLTVTAMSLLYLMVPNRYVPAQHAWLGGLIAGLCFEAMKSLFSSYVSHMPSYTLVYGAFAILPLFLLWIYLSWMTVLLGAVITAELPNLALGNWQAHKHSGQVFNLAVRVLTALSTAQLRGEILSLQQLAVSTQANWEQLEDVLAQLIEAKWVLRSGRGWALAMHPDHILLRAVFEYFVFEDSQQQPDLAMLVGYPLTSLSEWQAQSGDFKQVK